MDRYVCIHGHFYQPPRENAWIESIELQDSAYPYHDWNERITAECYAPNGHARILDDQDRIVGITNNYADISFNFGPTLLSWIEHHAPAVYQSILEADRLSIERYGGHGSAIAQPYNHMILPLANRRDKETQVRWGIRDFERRFGRRPEGMWLPETAVDSETLEVLVEADIAFTILSPYQAARTRKIGGRNWKDAADGGVDPSRAYVVNLPSGGKISVFFYDGPISRGVAFEGLLNNGVNFANRLLSGFDDKRDWPQLAHIATDGESYGHHHRLGEMALAFALQHIKTNNLAKLTNYGEYLERHPPGFEAEIVEKTAWSCAHGIGRWERDCSCHSGLHPGWHQTWRAPLREALDWLRDQVLPHFVRVAAPLLRDPWAARDDYVDVVLNRGPQHVDAFFHRHAPHPLSDEEVRTVLKLMELQRHAMLMYTSCGWFFDEVSGIETVQIIQYAARVVQLSRLLFDHDFEPGFLEILGRAISNKPEIGNGAVVYERYVRPAMVDLPKVAAHYAVSAMFEDYPEEARIGCYIARRIDHRELDAGQVRFLLGRGRMTSLITRETEAFSYAVLHMGDHNLAGGVRSFLGDDAYKVLVREGDELFKRADFPELVRFLDRQFAASTYSLKSLFRDEQRRILDRILESRLKDAENELRQLYEHHMPLLRFLADLGAPQPKAFLAAVEFVLNVDLRRAFEQDPPDLDYARTLLTEMARWPGVALDADGLAFSLTGTMNRVADAFLSMPHDAASLDRLAGVIEFSRESPFQVRLAHTQNCYHRVRETARPDIHGRAEQGDAAARTWLDRFDGMGEKLGFKVR